MSSQMVGSSHPRSQSFDAIVPGTSQTVSVGASSTQSSALQTSTSIVQLCATVACFVAFGTNPTAIAGTSLFLPANVPVKVGVNGGSKVAVIQSSSGGSLYVTEGA